MAGPTTARDLRRDALRNQQDLVRAATAAVHREGLRVPMGTIAADAGVGIGTLYRHFLTREDLLSHLTKRSFEQVLANARAADRDGATPIESLRLFVDAAIRQRNELVLPLHGGPPLTSTATVTVRTKVHRVLQRIIDRGIADGSLRPDVTPQDIVVFGSMLAQPRPMAPDWDATCRRLLATQLRGIAVGRSRIETASGLGARGREGRRSPDRPPSTPHGPRSRLYFLDLPGDPGAAARRSARARRASLLARSARC